MSSRCELYLKCEQYAHSYAPGAELMQQDVGKISWNVRELTESIVTLPKLELDMLIERQVKVLWRLVAQSYIWQNVLPRLLLIYRKEMDKQYSQFGTTCFACILIINSANPSKYVICPHEYAQSFAYKDGVIDRRVSAHVVANTRHFLHFWHRNSKPCQLKNFARVYIIIRGIGQRW